MLAFMPDAFALLIRQMETILKKLLTPSQQNYVNSFTQVYEWTYVKLFKNLPQKNKVKLLCGSTGGPA